MPCTWNGNSTVVIGWLGGSARYSRWMCLYRISQMAPDLPAYALDTIWNSNSHCHSCRLLGPPTIRIHCHIAPEKMSKQSKCSMYCIVFFLITPWRFAASRPIECIWFMIHAINYRPNANENQSFEICITQSLDQLHVMKSSRSASHPSHIAPVIRVTNNRPSFNGKFTIYSLWRKKKKKKKKRE